MKTVFYPVAFKQTIFTGWRRGVSGPGNASSDASSTVNLDHITSDQYAQAYLDYLFSDKGPVAALKNYFTEASENLSPLGCKNKRGERSGTEQSDGVQRVDMGKGDDRGRRLQKEEECERSDESLKLSIVETQLPESLDHNLHGAAST